METVKKNKVTFKIHMKDGSIYSKDLYGWTRKSEIINKELRWLDETFYYNTDEQAIVVNCIKRIEIL